MPDPDPLERIWIGKDERGGIPVPERKDVPPPPDWRLEAIAHDVRPRSLTVGPDGRTAVFIEDRDTSDLHVLDLGTDGAAPERLTTGREVMPYWEDTQPRISPDGTPWPTAEDGDVWLVPVTGGVPRRLVEGGGPVWLDDARLLVSIEHEIETVRTTRMTVVNVADPFPRRLARDHDDLDALGDEEDPDRLPRRRGGRVRLRPARRPQARGDPRRRHRDRPRARAHRHARHGRHRPRLVARRRDDRLRLRALGPP